MLRARSRQISRYTLQRNLRPSTTTSPESTLLQFPCPSDIGYRRWAQCYSSINIPSRKPPIEAGRGYSTAQAIEAVKLLTDNWSDDNYKRKKGPDKPDLLILENPKLPNEIPRRIRFAAGVSKDKHEVLATFEACVRVGRIARARLMLDEITRQLVHEPHLLINAHNTYLLALLKRAIAENNQESLRSFFSWYEDQMTRELQIEGDSTTYALLVRGSLHLSDSLLGQRYIKKYVSMWVKLGGTVKDLFEVAVLEPDEVIRVARTCGLKPEEVGPKYEELYRQEEPVIAPPITTVPEVQTSTVKGLSLSAVKQSLRSLIDPDAMPSPHAFGQDDLSFQIARQKLLEDDAFNSAKEAWQKDHEDMAAKGILNVSHNVNAMLWTWFQGMVPMIRQELDRVIQAEEEPNLVQNLDRCLYGPFLRLMSPDKIAAITILEVVKLYSAIYDDGVKSSQAVMAVGNILEQEYYAEEITKKRNKELFGNLPKEKIQALFDSRKELRMKINQAQKKIESEPEANFTMKIYWPNSIKAKLGAVLISMILHCAKTPVTRIVGERVVTQNHPAIYHTYQYIRGRKIGVIKFHAELIKKFAREPLRRGVLGRLLPMLVPPRPWMASNDGGYYYSFSKMMRTKSSREQEIYVRAASTRGDLEQVFEGLDVLGQTAWKINRKVFDVILEVWNKGEEFADIPPREMKREIPPEPSPSLGPAERAKWLNVIKELKVEERNNHSQRCDLNLKMEIARAFLFEKFYFPHNVDFRGRAYPIPPNLNHVGNDLSRGLLMFDKGKELGESGLRWLKIHLANLAGFDKASFTEREKYVDDHLEEVFDSADKPLEGKRWWLEGEDPWQLLAACIAVREAMATPDPSKYICHLPVAQDGTCNGLQHYAALGGDMVGAKQVNLEPSDKPQDVYTGVADLVNAQIVLDAAENHELALILKGHVTRKVVKQSVMTNVYGVTFIGARNQILSQLTGNSKIPREKAMSCASYLAKLVFASISTMFGGATKIQHWFALSAKVISRSVSPAQFSQLSDHDDGTLKISDDPRIRSKGKIEFMTSVVWTTPLGMPIVQPYRQARQQIVVTNLQKISIMDPSSIDQVNSRKQMTAFPPNFIHSLDATHMLLSATKCAENGLSFASVHDSFWTHPSDVDTLNSILRDAFISMHSQDVMKKLKEEFETRYKGYKHLFPVPRKTAFVKEIRRIRKEYCQELRARKPSSKGPLTIVEDLQWELERDRLLASEDPEEKARGEEMITPSVLFKRFGLGLETESVEVAELGSQEEKATEFIDDEEINGEEVLADEEVAEDSEDTEPEIEALQDGEEGEGEDDADEEKLDEVEDTEFKPEVDTTTKKAKPPQNGPPVYIWVPLKFPELPPKGEFDVTRLKESKYFFS
ncbi:hypothetical protein EDC01DRAFT_685897 [Geopyxis carbonaria]|nr:hypothetical protein EDC01DRAFT_685897 [Geopyxis carbonaria]